MRKLDQFTLAYIEAALFSSTDDDDEPMDSNYDVRDFSEESLDRIEADCKKFQEENGHLITDENYRRSSEYSTVVHAGHDFWYTRVGHGVGFWDGDWEKKAGELLTAASRKFGEVNIIVGDDGMLHHE